ncbi:MAG: DUF835 domain-containing protein [Thermoplasmata archaeon]|nr:MAG: DUF835 domain-containing protein [Thermoplasmata archaeon]
MRADIEPTITASEIDPGELTATWTFDYPDAFNTTETVIANSEAVLKTYDYQWNQSTQNDFTQGDLDNIVVTQKPFVKRVYSDDFESGSWGWVHGILDTGKDHWELGHVSYIPGFIGPRDSGSFVWGTKLDGKYDDDTGVPSDCFLQSPSIDLSDSEETKMTFWHYYDFENETVWNDGGRVEISVDNGVSWIPKFPFGGGYPDIIVSEDNRLHGEWCFVGNSTAWIQETFDLSSYDGKESLKIRFHFATDGVISAYGWYIDEIEITSTTYGDGELELTPRSVEIGVESANSIQRPPFETVIDINNPANVDGVLTEWWVHITSTTLNAKGKMKIFRPKGDKIVFVNETGFVDISVGRNEFTCYIEIRAGDYIGWYGEDASIYAKSEGVAYSMPQDISQNHSMSNWTKTTLTNTYSIGARGASRFPVGTIISQPFDAESPAMWEEIRWSETLPVDEVDIFIQTRSGNSSDPDDGTWNPWSSQLSNPNSSSIRSSDAQYIQFKATLSTTKQPFTPTLSSVSVLYGKYSTYGDIETSDFVPEFVVQWQDFTVDESHNELIQEIDYFYSIDSGENWDSVPDDGDLRFVSVLEGKIRFKMNLSTGDTTLSPIIREMGISYTSNRPDMGLYIASDKETAKPGDMVSFSIFYENMGESNAQGVSIALELDDNLTYRGDNSIVQPTVEEGNVIRWDFLSLEPPLNRTLLVDTKVKDDINKETVIVVRAVLNYSDIGGNQYDKVFSNVIVINIKISQAWYSDYLYVSAVIIVILIAAMILVFRRYKSLRDSEIKINYKDVGNGIGYLVMEENPTISYGIFSDLIDEGHSGLCITRTFPQRVKASYYFEGVSILWLSRSRDKNSILPTNLGGVLNYVKDFMEENENPVILLDGLEYLMVHNDFQRVLKLVHGLNELVAIYDAKLLMPLNPLTMDVDKVALFKRDSKILG